MKYRVIIKVGYNEAWFEFDTPVEACNFATEAISKQVKNEDTRKTNHIRIEVVDPTVQVEEDEE